MLDDGSVLDVGLIMALFGLGMGMFMAPNQSAIIGTVSRRNLATALGVANTMRLLGGAAGTAIAGTLYAHQKSLREVEIAAPGIAADMVERLATIESFQYVILLAAVVSFASIITSFFIGRPQPFPEDA